MKPTPFETLCANLVDRQLRRIRNGHLVVEWPDGRKRDYGDGSEALRLQVQRFRFFTRLVMAGNIGLGEAWTDSDWESDNLTGVLTLFIRNMDALKAGGLTAGIAKRLQHLLQHARHRNTREGSRRNIRAHYDLGNDFYRTFLDNETMLYSAALFDDLSEPLAVAQRRKIHRLVELAGIRSEHHVLEIGCGWGGFAIETARRTGCRVTGITISKEQCDFACDRVRAEGLEDRVSIVMCDYRDMRGAFDRIVSIEMLEAVGHAYYGAFFAACDRLLIPGGRVVLQVITIPDQRYERYRRNPDWIQKHIFPGGMLPSLTALSRAMTRSSRFTLEHLDNIGVHYGETLRRWRAACETRTDDLAAMGYDAEFLRQWRYYLCYCEAGFQTRFTNDLHLVLARPGEELS